MIKAYFRQEKETKGAIRYKEISAAGDDLDIAQGAALGTLYIRKTAFMFRADQSAPRILAVVIDEIELESSDG